MQVLWDRIESYSTSRATIIDWVVAIDYRRQIVFIKWMGRHADYDNIDVRTVKYGS